MQRCRKKKTKPYVVISKGESGERGREATDHLHFTGPAGLAPF